MNKLTLIILLLLSSELFSSVSVNYPQGFNQDTSTLGNEINHALQALAKHFPSFPELNLEIEINDTSCLQTGYQIATKKIIFCQNKNIINYGIESSDVIHHEVFHAFLCQQRPDFCLKPLGEIPMIIHEALADFFAFQLNHQPFFGQNYQTDGIPLRPLINEYCMSLMNGAHQKGVALTSFWIKNNLTLASLLPVLTLPQLDFHHLATIDLYPVNLPCFKVEDAPQLNLPPSPPHQFSKLHRYRFDKETILELNMAPNESFRTTYPRTHLRWESTTPSSIFSFTPNQDGTTIQVSANQAGTEKVILHIQDENFQDIGISYYYFSTINLGTQKP